MGTINDYKAAGEPLLATGTANVTDMTFRQLRQMTRVLPGLPAAGGVQGITDAKVTSGAGASVDVAAGYVWVAGTTITGAAGQQLYGVPISSTLNLATIPSPSSTTRRDLVVVRVYDEGDAPGSGIAAESRVQYIVNASETTTAEATPGNSLLLAYVDVTTGGAKTVTDRRWTLPVPRSQVLGGYVQGTSDISAGGDIHSFTVNGDGLTGMAVEAFANIGLTAASLQSLTMEIRDGASGTGTVYAKSRVAIGTSAEVHVLNPKGVVPAFSGTKTLYMRVVASSGTISQSDATWATTRWMRATWAPGYYTANP